MKILITGGTGFQGSNLAKYLLDKGHDVIILNLYSLKNVTNVSRFNLKKANIIWGTINDIHTVKQAMRNTDLVVHAAAKIHVDDSIENPAEYFYTNVMGTNNVFEVARNFDIPVIHISTCEVYGYQDKNLTEDCPLMPRSPYAASKAAADRMAYSYYTTYNMNICIVRPFNIFGLGQKDGKCGAVIPIWATQLFQGKDIDIYGSGNQFREFMYISDLISAYKIIIDKMVQSNQLAGEVINIGSGIDISIKDLAQKMINLVEGVWIPPKNHDFSYGGKGKVVKGKINFISERPGEVKRFISDSTKIKSFGWEPNVTVEQGLKKYIMWRKDIDDEEWHRNLMVGM